MTDEIKNDRGEVVFIEYYRGRPNSAITCRQDVDRSGVTHAARDYWDFNWSRRDRTVYYRRTGVAGVQDALTVELWKNTRGVMKFWASADARIIYAGGRAVRSPSRFGWERLSDPIGGDPFALGEEHQCKWCGVCWDNIPEDRLCSHLFMGDDGHVTGPGMCWQDQQQEDKAKADILAAVRRIGGARMFHRMIANASRTFDNVNVIDRLFNNREFGGDGLRWPLSLDEKTKEANDKILLWLKEEIAAQNTRRASGEHCYAVFTHRWHPTRRTGPLPWNEVLPLARGLRGTDSGRSVGWVWIVRLAKQTKTAVTP